MFGYDALGRLTSSNANGATSSMTYDASGNRVSVQTSGITSSYTTAHDSNRLLATSYPKRNYSHDAAGNTIAVAGFFTTMLAYDLAGRLAAVWPGFSPPDEVIDGPAQGSYGATNYVVDGMGRRVLKTVWTSSASAGPSADRRRALRADRIAASGTTMARVTVYVYDVAGQLLGEYDGATGKTLREYAWLGSTPVAMFAHDPASGATETFRIHADHLGAPRALMDRSNRWRWAWFAEPFGSSAANESPGGLPSVEFNLRFPGQYFDVESGLHYNYFRDYEPTIGRYVQSDPIGLAGGINTYAYVGSAPTAFTDPLGLWSTEAHNYFIDTYFAHPPSSIRDLIKAGSEYADSPLYQDGAHSFMHAMSSGAMDKERAKQLFCKFLKDKMNLYRRDLNRQRGARNAYINLGMALHAVMDSTSPVHRGFQRWDSSQIQFHGPRQFGPMHRPHTREDVDVAPHYREQTHRRMRDLMNGQLPPECGC